MKYTKDDEPPIQKTLLALIVTILAILALLLPAPPAEVPEVDLIDIPPKAEASVSEVKVRAAPIETDGETRMAMVTGYNTVPEQTDSTPCIAASGDNICGRSDVVACPYDIALGTEVFIDGNNYVCLDRTAKKFDGRFDISCDKDMECPYQVHGFKEVIINY